MSDANNCKQWSTRRGVQVRAGTDPFLTMPRHSVGDSLLFACFPRLGLLQQQKQQVV